MHLVFPILSMMIHMCILEAAEVLKRQGMGRIMTPAGGAPPNYQNYQINQIDSSFFLTTAAPPTPPDPSPTIPNGISINVDDVRVILVPPATIISATSENEPQTTISPLTTEKVNVLTTPALPTTITIELLTTNSPEQTTVTTEKATTVKDETSQQITTATTPEKSTSLATTILPTTLTTSRPVTETPSVTSTSQTTKKSSVSTTTNTVTEAPDSNIIIFPSEDNSQSYVTFSPLIYRLVQSQQEIIRNIQSAIIFPSEITIIISYPSTHKNETIRQVTHSEAPTTQMPSTSATPSMQTEIVTEVSVVEAPTTTAPGIDNNLKINISDFIDIVENIDLSDKNRGNDFGQRAPIHKLKCNEYSSNFKGTGQYTKKNVASHFQTFIVGGTASEEKEFPHMAALGYGNGIEKQWLCGGSLISETYILTAAHCLSAKDIGEVLVVRLGTTTLQTETLESADYGIFRRISHPDYEAGQQYNDIALIELERPVTFTEYISPICITADDQIDQFVGRKFTAIGWGKTSPTERSKELQKVELEYFSHDVCQQKYSIVSKQDLPRGIDGQTHICAGSETEIKDSCQGDSGGPLQAKGFDFRNYLIGITSFGIGCGIPGIPGVYTRVAHYIPWIESIVWSN